jgi:transcriptional regulator with XRE-family HTH domain
MIKQPELGKKIADLRKAKVMTQEALVEKCNLNVRTLQRIESGETTPRTYTLRLIFEALEYSFEESENDKGLILKWLERFYISFTDLFKLKTNTMKKVSILITSIVVLLFIVVLLLTATKTNTEKMLQTSESYQTNDPSQIVVPKNPWIGELEITNFSQRTGFSENELFIGMYVKFDYHGTHVEAELISINAETKKFNIGSFQGIFRNDRIDIAANEMFFKNFGEYSADKIEKSKNTVHLYGNAKIVSWNKEYLIESDELLITFR